MKRLISDSMFDILLIVLVVSLFSIAFPTVLDFSKELKKTLDIPKTSVVK